MYSFLSEYFSPSPYASRHQVPCGTSQVVLGAHRVVGPGTHRGSGPREVHTTSTTISGHQEVNHIASSSSSVRMASSNPSGKRGREEMPPPPPAESEELKPPPPAKLEKVPLPPPVVPGDVLPPRPRR
jgi:hypothetical protein